MTGAKKPGLFEWGGWDRSRWRYTPKETVWYVILFLAPILSLRILYVSAKVAASYKATGTLAYPGGYWWIVAITLAMCALVPYLLKDSNLRFRLGAIVLTSAAPAFLIIFALYRLWQIAGRF